jgi:hypothetical protein
MHAFTPLAAVLAVVSMAGVASAAPLGDGATLVYEVKRGFLSSEISAKASALGATRTLVAGNETVLYDWESLVSVVMNDAPAGFDPQIKVEGTPATAPGSRWRVGYRQMPSSTSQCREASEQDVEIEVEAGGKATVQTAAGPVEVDTVTLNMNGSWSACRNNGAWKSKRVLAPQQHLMLSNDFSSWLLSGQTVGASKARLLRLTP